LKFGKFLFAPERIEAYVLERLQQASSPLRDISDGSEGFLKRNVGHFDPIGFHDEENTEIRRCCKNIHVSFPPDVEPTCPGSNGVILVPVPKAIAPFEDLVSVTILKGPERNFRGMS
jgi:hypothetical protein